MQVSAVVCTHQRYELCRKAIKSLLDQNKSDEEDEIIVVDNTKCKKAADEFAASYKNEPINFIHTTTIGLSNARNIGLRAARGRIVAYLDDDAIAAPDWARAIAAAFEAYGERAGAVGGPVRPIWLEPPPAWLDVGFLELLSIIDRGPLMRELGASEWLAGCNIAFARDALLEVGGFDTALGRIGGSLLSNEETAVCDRMRDLGLSVIYAPDVVVDHLVLPARATAQFIRRRIAWQAVSDALTHPRRSREHAISTQKGWSSLAWMRRAIRFIRLVKKGRNSMSREDFEIVYDLANQLLCYEEQ